MNKKINKLLLVLMLAVMIPFVATATSCGKKVTKIDIISTNTTYNIGDELNIDDFSIVVTYSNDSTETIAVTTDMLKEPLPILESEGSYTITVNYEKEDYTITINVINPRKINSISASEYRTEYYVDEEFIANGKLTIIYKNAEMQNEVIDITDAMISQKPDMTTAGEKTVVVTYDGATCEYKIIVEVATITGVHFENVPTFYNTTKEENLNLGGNKVIVEFSDGTNRAIEITDDMIIYVPDFNTGKEDYTITVNILGHNYGIPVNVVMNPEYLAYRELIEKLQTVLQTGIRSGANVDLEAVFDFNSKIKGQEGEPIHEELGKLISFEEIDDLYIRAILSDIVTSLIDIENYTDFNNFIKDNDINLSNIDIVKLVKILAPKMLDTTMNFDYYEYVNSYPMLVMYKNNITEIITGVINNVTFSFEKYEETEEEIDEPIMTENYSKLMSIVEETIVKAILQHNYDGKNFLERFKTFASELPEEYDEISTISTNLVEHLMEGESIHILSTFLKDEIEVIRIYRKNNLPEEYYFDEDLNEDYVMAEIIEIIETYIFQSEENEITIEETILAINEKLETYISECVEEERNISGYIIIANDIVSIMAEPKKLPEIALNYIYEFAVIETQANISNYQFEIENYEYELAILNENPTENEERIDEINYEIDTLKDLIKYSQKDLDTISELFPIVIEYAHKISYNEEVNHCEYVIDMINVIDDEYASELQKFYDENGYIPLIGNYVKTLNSVLESLIADEIGESNYNTIANALSAMAERIDTNAITESENDLATDLETIFNMCIIELLHTDDSILLNIINSENPDKLIEIFEIDSDDYFEKLNLVVKDLRLMILGDDRSETFYKDLYELSLVAIAYGEENTKTVTFESVYNMIISYYNQEENTISDEDMLEIIKTFEFDLNIRKNISKIIEYAIEDILFGEDIPENLNEQMLYDTIYMYVGNLFEYMFYDGQPVNHIDFAYDLSEQLKDYVAYMDVANYILASYKNETLIYDVANTVFGGYIKVETETETETGTNFLNSALKTAEIIDKYYMPYSTEEIPEEVDLFASIANTMALMRDVAIERNDTEVYLITEVYYQFLTENLSEEEIETRISKLATTIELYDILSCSNVDEFVEISEFVSNIYDAYIDQTLTTRKLLNEILNYETTSNFVYDFIGSALELDEDGINTFKTLTTDLMSAYNGEEVVIQDVAQEYFDFVTEYAKEEDAPVLYGIGVIVLVMNDQDVDYNELFKNVKLPETMEGVNVDYNNIIKLLLTKEEIMNSIHYSTLQEAFEYDEDGNIVGQTLSINITLDFDITFIVLNGSLNLSLDLDF